MDILRQIDIDDNKSPTMKAHQEVNKPIADRVLANIQNGIVNRVKGEQIQHKKSIRD